MFKHIHIVACSPRSGTTLLHEVMVTCFKVDKHYDHEIRFNLVDAEDGQILITKRPKDTMYMPSVIDDDADIYVIYVMRDPRDVICSRHGKNKDLYYSNVRLWREMHGYAKQMAGHDRFLEIRYEDFVRDPDATQDMIARKFPWLEKIHDFSDYHEYAQVSEKSITAMHSVRPIAPTSVGVWTRHPGRIKAQQIIHGSLSPDLIECGYETSADWEQVLDAVEPDFSRSRYPEKVYFWSRISQHINALRKVAMYRRKRRSA
ncbi:MAG: sulfotransferase [Gammaproteobacteria bacterium]|nr:sulfotransferase [Gammaproteobacteria bacterium]MDH3428432.1 sulfotransferase [Gammaproteobacteria bacterium]MDH3433487.1 sulfotransferase [Gammaproteobacteria bacterium]